MTKALLKRNQPQIMLARKAIAEWCSVAPESIVFDTKEHGKPYAVNLNVEFNISHSNDLVICAINDTPIGVDIEKIRPIDISIIKRVCNKDELEYVLDDDSYKHFFEIWAFKEAYFKFLGTGITNFKSIDYFNTDKNKLMIAYNEYIIHLVN